LIFASPRKLPRARDIPGRVVVIDIAFASEGLGKGFDKTTGAFIRDLGPRLARWVDHHDHPAHARFAGDRRFVLATKAQHGACPEMIDEALVHDTGPIDSIVAHFDLDGLYAAAKWILGGREPYPGADADARAVDTRIGTPSLRGARIDKALRIGWNDDVLKTRIVRFLVEGCRPGLDDDSIAAAAASFDVLLDRTRELAEWFRVEDGIASLQLPPEAGDLDKTELLLLGQRKAPVAMVIDHGNATIAASFESGLDFVELLGLGGGMPTRVSIPAKRAEEARAIITAHLKARANRP
jgi:hypothetical protein